jgi:hypothetical protein
VCVWGGPAITRTGKMFILTSLSYPIRIYGNTGTACQLSKTSPMGWNCETAARFVSGHAEDLANIGVKIRTITMRGVDTNTFVGRVICDSAREVSVFVSMHVMWILLNHVAGRGR